MPIYEFLCRRCNRIFQFLFRMGDTTADPACPRCGDGAMERMMSSFSTSRRSKADASADDAGEALEGMDGEDPRSMARAIRRMAEEMGEDLEPELDEAISRLEAGEDPEQIERDLEDSGFGDSPGAPYRDPGLYEP